MRIKLGIDPTAKDLHLGHTVPLRKLRTYQDAGDTAVLIIGDFTTRIGDPSGRSELRPMLTPEQIKDNEAGYLEMASKVLDIKKTEIHHNSEWFEGKGMDFLMDLMRRVTVAQVLEREDFQNRMKSGVDVSLLEIIYPLLQGYDSVAIKADVEIGGTDQTFNLHMGRRMQRSFGVKEQDIVTLPILEGLDGVKKMSKSLGNYVGLNDAPDAMFGKLMSIPDVLMPKYYELLTDLSFDSSMSPKQAKMKLAEDIVRQYYGEAIAQPMGAAFDEVHAKGGTPESMPELTAAGASIADAIAKATGDSKAQAKRLLDEGAVSVNGAKVTDWNHVVQAGDILRIGPHRFFKVI